MGTFFFFIYEDERKDKKRRGPLILFSASPTFTVHSFSPLPKHFVNYKEQTEPDTMDSILLLPEPPLAFANHRAPAVSLRSFSYQLPCPVPPRPRRTLVSRLRGSFSVSASGTLTANSVPVRCLLRLSF